MFKIVMWYNFKLIQMLYVSYISKLKKTNIVPNLGQIKGAREKIQGEA